MKIYVKYLILIFAFSAGFKAFSSSGIAAGAFIAYALIEIQDLKIINKEDNKL